MSVPWNLSFTDYNDDGLSEFQLVDAKIRAVESRPASGRYDRRAVARVAVTGRRKPGVGRCTVLCDDARTVVQPEYV